MVSITIEDACKKDFEVFCDFWNYDKTTDEFGFYANSLTQRCLDSFSAGWQASRKALVVELPVAWEEDCGLVISAHSVELALDAAGVSHK